MYLQKKKVQVSYMSSLHKTPLMCFTATGQLATMWRK